MSDAELRDMIEFLKLVGNDKAVAELEGILHSRKGSSSAALEESDGRDNPVVNSIVRRIMISHPDLLGTYGPEKVLNAIYDVAEFVGDVEEIGSSDVSGWVKYVIDSLERHGSNIKESQDKSSVSMPARKLYAKTYAKHAKTVKDAKKAEKMAYDAVKEKFGQEILNQLKKHHNQSKDSKQDMAEAKYQGRTVPLNKPMKGDVKKRKVYVRKPNGNVVKVEFGDKNMRIKKSNPARRKSFRARHRCDNPGPKWKARYWSCRFW
jgi:hypothetical protein